MSITSETANDLAEAAWQAFNVPESMVVEDTSGANIETSGSTMTFSTPVFYRGEDQQDGPTSTAYFNVSVNLDTADLSDVYCITSDSGNLVGSFTDDCRRAAYLSVGIADPASSPGQRL